MKAPERGAIIKLNFDPKMGHEQAGYRPALVVSNSLYNAQTGLMIACPITSQVKGYPLEVVLPDSLLTQGAVLVNQVKALDWQARGYNAVEKAPVDVMQEVWEKLVVLLNN